MIGGRLGKKSGLGVYDWRAEREAVVGLEAVSDSFSPMKVEKKSDGVTEIDDVLLIETQGETAQALAIRLARPVVVIDKMAGKVVTIAAAAVNPDSATRKAILLPATAGQNSAANCRLPRNADLANGSNDHQ